MLECSISSILSYIYNLILLFLSCEKTDPLPLVTDMSTIESLIKGVDVDRVIDHDHSQSMS